MPTSLVPCPSCARHVRAGESVCPFCASAIPAGLAPKPHGPVRRYVGKNATALAIASALTAAGCGEGATATEGVLDSGTPSDAVVDTRTDAPSDVLSETASDVRDEGGSVPLYK